MATHVPPSELLRRAQNQAAEKRDTTVMSAHHSFKEAKKQVEEACKMAKAKCADKEARNQAEKEFKEAVKKAEALRDSIVNEATAAFRDAWEKAEKDYRASAH